MKTFREETGTGTGMASGTTTASVQNFDPILGQGVMRRYRQFDVDEAVFAKFQKGRVRFERWSRYLDLTNEAHRAIYEYARRNRSSVIILRNSANGALRSIRRRASNE